MKSKDEIKKYNLHLHTNFSTCADKNNSWEKLLKLLDDNGFNQIAITDHNTCIFHLINMYRDTTRFYKGEIISGIECDVCEDGISFEVLGYNFDVMKIFNWSYRRYGTPSERYQKIKNVLLEKVLKNNLKIGDGEFDYKNEYAHQYIYNEMIKIEENKNFFAKYNIENYGHFYRLSTTCKSFPLYVDMKNFFPNLKEVVKMLNDAGGIAVLAHPYNYGENLDVERLLSIVVENNINGIEVFHPSVNSEQIDYLINFAKKHNLIITGGSDYHGNEYRSQIEVPNIDYSKYKIDF